ncbi:MAG: hypothetical protein JW775_01290, partial [Candidatus Aminicenantes bacterium]|nr:hypothetical protein [Candidatus Aminicenantes bacterium]
GPGRSSAVIISRRGISAAAIWALPTSTGSAGSSSGPSSRPSGRPWTTPGRRLSRPGACWRTAPAAATR